ncbi:hypothetical protein POV27_12090 [Aureisphaera galaxeae]|uniref:hypothetical protein n=1 Tax=Aureisphaera galaxeae TaxID=1538023 RepID=UPI0023509961|nr:hypothetical protein [Aureisphaera galaxeae]MDC8004795.1 hypothetical protein [Aureisphaera galaxeae]
MKNLPVALKLILFIYTLFLSSLARCQEKKDPTAALISELKVELNQEGVSDFFVVKHITYGSFRIYNTKDPNVCIPDGYYFNLYAFWRMGNTNYIKKMDNCGAFNTIELKEQAPFDFYSRNIVAIKNEEVGRYRLKPDSIANGLRYSFARTQSHSPLRYYWFYRDTLTFEKRFDKFNLTTDSESPNINFESNHNLAIVKLNAICEEIIAELSEKEVFHRLD